MASASSASLLPLASLLTSRPRAPRTLNLAPLLPRSPAPSCRLFSFAARGGRFAATVRNVAFSSEFEVEQQQDEELEGAGVRFSEDLKLFVGNLPFNVDSAQLAGLFGQAGNVELAEVVYDKITGRSRGFGFVTMSTVEEVEAAFEQFNGYELGGRSIRVNSGPPPRKDESPRGMGTGSRSNATNKIFVGNLSWGVDDSVLESLFREHGNVLEAKVVYDRESGRSRGFGFVTYSSADEVHSAISSLDGVDLDGRNIRVSAAESGDSRPRRRY